MKKLFFAWIMALWCFPAVFAQSGQGIRYQGEVGVGTAFGVGSNAYDRFVLETVHGVRIGPRLFVGLGVAWNYYSARGDMPDDSFREYTDGGRSFVPIFADMKVYFLDRRISPYLKVDIGYGIHKHGGIYAAPAVGVKFGLGSVLALNIDFGFQVQQQTAPDTSSGLGGILFHAESRFIPCSGRPDCGRRSRCRSSIRRGRISTRG